MTETNKSSAPAVILAGEQYARQQLAEEMRVRNADPLDESKRDGGFFLRDDGTPVDANGIEIDDSDLESDEKAAGKAHKDAAAANQPRRAAPKAKKK